MSIILVKRPVDDPQYAKYVGQSIVVVSRTTKRGVYHSRLSRYTHRFGFVVGISKGNQLLVCFDKAKNAVSIPATCCIFLQRPDEVAKRSFIYVKFQKEGIHKYPAALTDPALATGDPLTDVSFLGYPHRHLFHFVVKIEVGHNDRDIEFIQFKRWLENLYSDGTLQLDFKSCEMIAEELHRLIRRRYPNRAVTIDVSEDNENGAIIEFGAK